MLVLTVNKKMNIETEALKRIRARVPNAHLDKVTRTTSARLSEKIACLPKARREKVLDVRRRLDAGTYGIKKRLDMATDRLIEALLKKETEEDETRCKSRRLQK